MEDSLKQLENALSDDPVVHIENTTNHNGEYTKPYPIGYAVLDEAIKGGVRAGDLIVGTGITSHGKTTFFQNISVNLSNAGNKCIWFSYEMLADNFYAKFKEMGCDCKNLKLYAPKQMTSGNLEWVQEKIKEGLEKYNTKFVFIDHIDFLVPQQKLRNSDQKRMVIESICIELKTLAIKLEVVIFLISHVKKVQGRAIEVQDTKESISVSQIADVVLVAERYVEVINMGGKKTEIFTGESAIRFLKNRIGGETPTMNFYLKNNIIVPKGETPFEVDDEPEIMVVKEDSENETEEQNDQVRMFGEKD